MSRIVPVLLASLAGLAAAAEPAPPPGYNDLPTLFASLRGQHLKLSADRTLELSVDSTGSDHFCGRSARGTLCLPYASIAWIALREPGAHQVQLKPGIRLP